MHIMYIMYICVLYGQLLLYAYHVKLRKAYVKLVFTSKAAAE